MLQVAGLDITVGGLVAATVVLLLTALASWLLRRTLARYGQHNASANRATLYTLSRVLHYLLLIFGLLLALDLAGIPIGKFGLFAGALGVGLGFGLQAIFSNFISGLILLFDRSLKVGDFVELASGVHGHVRDIKIRATRISTNDNIDILVPNSEFVTGRVVNWTHREVSRRMRIPFGVAYGTDKEMVKKAALEAAVEVPFTLAQDGPRKPQVWLVELGSSSLNFELVVWLTAEATKRPSAVKAAYTWALHSALQKYAIEIPFPQQDLHIRSLFGRNGDAALAWLRETSGSDAQAPGKVQDALRDAPKAQELSARERTELGANDAQQEVQQQIDEDQAASEINDVSGLSGAQQDSTTSGRGHREAGK
ncbi:MAG: mechanosensitive ion channel [Gammaproteobacteria bacterium]|nr:mechanosensitive ion channel [Gammaproteobacteria bacterium]